MTAVIRGPYCTGAVTPSGAVPHVVVPHEHRRVTSWCSRPPAPISAAGRTPAAAQYPPQARPPDPHRSPRTDPAHAAAARPDRRPTPASILDGLADHPACV